MHQVVALVLVACINVVAAEDKSYHVERLYCHPDQSAIGMTIGSPSTTWGPQGDFFVCLRCSEPLERRREILEIDNESEDEFEERRLQNIKSLFTHETCSFFGDSKRTLVQKFDCFVDEYLRGFQKPNNSLTTSLSCSKVDKKFENISVYESRFPDRGGRRIRNNWLDWDLKMQCNDEDEYICGIETKIMVDSETPPELIPTCCSVKWKKGQAEKFATPAFLRASSGTAWIVVLTILVVILVVIVALCIINIWCCRILSPECYPTLDENNYFSRKSIAENGNGNESEFNTRPNTAANGRNKRPMTSTIRKPSTVDVAP